MWHRRYFGLVNRETVLRPLLGADPGDEAITAGDFFQNHEDYVKRQARTDLLLKTPSVCWEQSNPKSIVSSPNVARPSPQAWEKRMRLVGWPSRG